MQAEGVEGEQVGDGEVLLLVAHVGAANSGLPQSQVCASLNKIPLKTKQRQRSTNVISCFACLTCETLLMCNRGNK